MKGGRIEKINSTRIVMRTTQATSADQQLAVATERHCRKSTRLSCDVPISGVIATVRQYSAMHSTLQKSERDVSATVKLFSVMMLKTITNERKTLEQKPVNPTDNRGISQIDLGDPKDR